MGEIPDNGPQFTADNDRLAIAALANGDGLDPDEMIVQALEKRIMEKFGPEIG